MTARPDLDGGGDQGPVEGASAITLLKLGGELLEPGDSLPGVIAAIAALAAEGPLVIVHGGGREIDAETKRRGVPKQAAEGLRITDAATLEAVIAVLAGTINTRLVAALVARGVPAVGLTGVDAALGLSARAPAHRTVDGQLVDLGLVGQPLIGQALIGQPRIGQPTAGQTPRAPGGAPRTTALLRDLIGRGYVPAIACLGIDAEGQVLNVNADTLAAALAAALQASRLIIAGATAGVFDRDNATIETLDDEGIDRMIADGSASAGMIAKLRACRAALDAGVGAIAIVSGRHAAGFATAPGTRLVQSHRTGAGQGS